MIDLSAISKSFGQLRAVDNVDLQVRTGEFLSLLGPSGCGKTTLLRLIAGFESPDSGAILLDGRDVTTLPPYKRDVCQVFQSYALFPHMSVWENVAFGLRMRGLPRRERDVRVKEALAMVSLSGSEAKRPRQLSGGQQQRVALARAIVCRPKVLLLDEPLSALDAKLRHAMQLELRQLHQQLGITFVFVTHDQSEALTMSDRVAVMNAGQIEQLGPPAELYNRPQSIFAANFVGQANILAGEVVAAESNRVLVRVGEDFVLPVESANFAKGAAVNVIVRPEKLRILTERQSSQDIPATIVDRIFSGPSTLVRLRGPGGIELIAITHTSAPPVDSNAFLAISAGDVHLLPLKK